MMYCRISYQICMYLARSSNELRLNRIWIIAWCFQVHFTCITYVNHMNYVWFISISYHVYMEFTWSCREVYDQFVQEDACVNFIWTSYELNTIFMIVSNELDMQLIWKTVEFYIRYLTMTSECVWNSYEVVDVVTVGFRWFAHVLNRFWSMNHGRLVTRVSCL